MTEMTPAAVVAHPGLAEACAPLIAQAHAHFEAAQATINRAPRAAVEAPQLMAAAYADVLARLKARLRQSAHSHWRRQGQLLGAVLRSAGPVLSGAVHVMGAGLAGLAAATRLAAEGHRVIVHEAARMAGGRAVPISTANSG